MASHEMNMLMTRVVAFHLGNSSHKEALVQYFCSTPDILLTVPSKECRKNGEEKENHEDKDVLVIGS